MPMGSFGAGVGGGMAVGVMITAKDMYSQKFAKAQADLVRLRKVSETQAAKIERSLKIGQTMMKTGMAITAASFMIDRALQKSVETAADFDQALQNIMTLAPMKEGITNAQQFRDELTEAIQSAATESGKGMIDLANSTYPLISGISNAREGLAAIPYVAKLSRAAMGSTESAVDVLTNTLNTYGQAWGDAYTAQEKANRITNLYSATVADAKTNLDDLNTAVSYSAPAAIEAGMSLEELLAVLGKLQSAGLEASMSGTYIRQMLASMTRNAGKLKAIGVDMYDTQGNARSLIEVFAELGEKTKTMSDEEKASVMLDIFNVRGKGAANILTALGDNLEATVKEYGQMADATGEASIAQEMFNEAMKGGRAQIEQLEAEQEKMRIQLAEKLMPAQIKFQMVMTKGMSAILDLPVVGEVAKWGVAFAGLGAKVGKIVGPTMTLVGMLQQMRAMKKITLALENKGVAASAGKGIAGAFKGYLAAAGISIAAATIAYALVTKMEEKRTAKLTAGLYAGKPEEVKEIAEKKGRVTTGILAGFNKETWQSVGLVFSKSGRELLKTSSAMTQYAVESDVIERKKNEVAGFQKATQSELKRITDERTSKELALGEQIRKNEISQDEYKVGLERIAEEYEVSINRMWTALKNLSVTGGGEGTPVEGSRQSGGKISETGLYEMHAPEYVLTPDQLMRVAQSGGGGAPPGGGKGGGTQVTQHLEVHVHGTNVADPQAIAKAVSEMFKRMAKRTPL